MSIVCGDISFVGFKSLFLRCQWQRSNVSKSVRCDAILRYVALFSKGVRKYQTPFRFAVQKYDRIDYCIALLERSNISWHDLDRVEKLSDLNTTYLAVQAYKTHYLNVLLQIPLNFSFFFQSELPPSLSPATSRS